MTRALKSMWAKVRATGAWARRREISRVRYIIAVIVVIVAVVLFVGSRQIDSWQSCRSIERGTRIEKDCSPLEASDLLWVPLLLGVLLWPDLEELNIVGLGGFRRRRKGAPAESGASAKQSNPRATFLDQWQILDGWSRLASRLASPKFRERLANATSNPGAVEPKTLGGEDQKMIEKLDIGPRFSAAGAETWAQQSQDQLDELRALANESLDSSPQEYVNGTKEAEELLDQLTDRGLRAS